MVYKKKKHTSTVIKDWGKIRLEQSSPVVKNISCSCKIKKAQQAMRKRVQRQRDSRLILPLSALYHMGAL